MTPKVQETKENRKMDYIKAESFFVVVVLFFGGTDV
jgi:hypothetical protein